MRSFFSALPLAFLAPRVTSNVPALESEPVIRPVFESIFNPLGKPEAEKSLDGRPLLPQDIEKENPDALQTLLNC